MQLKRVLTLLLTVVFVFSLAAPASAVDAVYSVSPDASVLSAPIYYTDGYYPGLVAEMRNAGMFANRIAHGSYSTYNYNPHWIYRQGHDALGYEYFTGDFNALTPFVTADQTDVSGIYMVDKTTLLSGNMLIFYLPSTSDAYFDFQSSNFVFDQQSPQANTFYINGDLTFSLRNLWSFSGTQGSDSFYLASDPLAVQLVIDGKPYGDIIDVTGYTSPFTALYNGGLPSNATVTFNNMKVYYQGDTPDMIGFRVYTGSSFTDGQYNYNNAGDFVGVDVENSITLRCSEIPDITFVQEGGDGYAGDLSGIQSSLSSLVTVVNNGFTSLRSLMVNGSGVSLFSQTVDNLASIYRQLVNTNGVSWLDRIYWQFNSAAGNGYLQADGNGGSSTQELPFSFLFRYATLGLSQNIKTLIQQFQTFSGNGYLSYDGSSVNASSEMSFALIFRQATLGLAKLSRDTQSYVANTVFPWRSFNMQTHQLNTATNITGQNNLFLTAFQSMEDKLGRLAYVFGSDEDLALKDSADPGTDAFRENFGGGLSLGQIKDGADVVKGVNGLFDSGYDFGDAFSEISGDSMFTMWFSSQNAAALDSTSSVMALDDEDPYNMQIYYDRIQEVTAKRDREEGDTND